MDSRKFKRRIQQRLYHACASDCDSDSDVDGLSTSSLPLTETCMEYFQDSFPGSEGLGRLDMPMAATITKRNQVSPCSVVLSMMYAKRLRQRNQQYLHSMSSTDVFFISMMMASKYLYDEGVDEEVYNDEWAASVGHETEDVNQMEMDFLKEMDWHLFAKHEDFDTALTAVERRLALREGVRRGWFTYTEMSVLLDWEPMLNLWNQVSVDCTKMVSLLSAVYVTSLVSMMGSAAIALQLSGPLASATIATALSLHSSISTVRSTVALASMAIQDYGGLPTMEMVVDSGHRKEGVFHSQGMSSVTIQNELEGFLTDNVKENCSIFTNGDTVLDPAKHGGGLEGQHHDKEELKTSATLSNPKLKPASSVFSMWLFDSLLSQVWSVFDSSKNSSASSVVDSGSTDASESRGLEVVEVCENCMNSGKHRNKCRGGKRSRKQQSSSSSPTFRHGCTRVSTDIGTVGELGLDRLCFCSHETSSGLMKNSGANADFVSAASSTKANACCSDDGCEKKKCLLCKTETVAVTNSCSSSMEHNCHQPGTKTTHCHPSDKATNVHNVNNLSSHQDLPPLSCSQTTPDNNNNIDLTIPLSLLAEVPILDPVGFFTKNSSPASYVLST